MKTLKLDHNLSDMIRQGTKTSTWRLYDDKDIRVNDELQLIDKVDAKNPDTWRVFGVARVNTVIEKRLGDITAADSEGHEPFASTEEMLKTYQKYYGPQVTVETPVKIIHFTYKAQQASDYTPNPAHTKEVKLYADGGSRGNPGPSASGFAIMNAENDHVIVKKGVYLGITTNNQAEYQALKFGLEEAHTLGVKEVHVFMDSLLVINQMLGIFKVKNRDLWPIHESIEQLAKQFKQVSFTHIPRELNKIADRVVNDTLDETAKEQ